MQESKKLQKRYDHVIIGYNLASLSFAYELSKKGLQFCVVDSRHLNGSGTKVISSIESLVATRIPFNSPFSTEHLSASPFGEVELRESTPITYDKGDFKSFLGFGKEKILAEEAVTPFCNTQNSHPQLQPEEYWQKALTEVESHLFLDQQITGIEHENSEITSVTLNAKTTLSGSHFYFFEQFSFLFEQLGSEMKKQASQFAKPSWYSSVNLIIHHNEEPESYELDQLYLLMGSKNQPCLGQFSRINGHLISRWESFIPAELTPDSETTGAAYKEIKKQIKRAFNQDSPSLGAEHILLHDRVYSNLAETGIENGKLNAFNNLSVYSPLFTNSLGWAHEILCGLDAAESLPSQFIESPAAQPSL